MPNLLSRLGSSFKAFVFGESKNQNIGQAYGADPSNNNRHAPRPTTSSTGQRSDQLERPPAQRADAANRRRIVKSMPLLSKSDRELAWTLATSAIIEDPELKKRKRRFQMRLVPVNGQEILKEKTVDEKIALALAASAIESDKDLKYKGVQFDIRALPLPSPDEEYANNLKIALARSASDRKSDSQNLVGGDTGIGPSIPDEEEIEEVALALARVASAIKSDPSLEDKSVQFDIPASSLPTSGKDAKNLAIGLALSAIMHQLKKEQPDYQFDVSIVPPGVGKTSLEEVAINFEHNVNNQDSLLKDIKIDVRIKPRLLLLPEAEQLKNALAISKEEFDTASSQQSSSPGNPFA